MINRVILSGRLTKDPELRKTSSGKSTCSFTVAVDRRYKQGEESKADFPRCVAWGQTADYLCNYGSKGQMVELEGRLQTGSYTGKDGQTVYTTDVAVDSVDLIRTEPKRESRPQGTSYQYTKDVVHNMEPAEAEYSEDLGDELPF